MKTTTLITLCTLALTMGIANAGEADAEVEAGKERQRPERKERGERGKRGKRGEHPGGEAMQAFIKSQREAGRAHHEAQGTETKALIEGLHEGTPQAGCTALAAHRQTQSDENAQFQQGQNEALVAFMRTNAADNEIPEEKVTQHLEKMQAHFEERTKRHAEMSQAVIAKLTELSGKDELTWEEVKQTMKSMHRSGRKGEGKQHRRGKRKGKDADDAPHED